jgi:PPOX class probable F420-dependent enzyme
MSLEQVREEFLTRTRFCVLGTLRKDGRARLSPMAYVYENGVLSISTTRTRGGGRTAKRDPRVTVCCFDPQKTGEYVTVYGRAQILESEADSVELLGKIQGRSLQGEALEAVKRRIADEGRIVLRITPDEYFVGAGLAQAAVGG